MRGQLSPNDLQGGPKVVFNGFWGNAQQVRYFLIAFSLLPGENKDTSLLGGDILEDVLYQGFIFGQ